MILWISKPFGESDTFSSNSLAANNEVLNYGNMRASIEYTAYFIFSFTYLFRNFGFTQPDEEIHNFTYSTHNPHSQSDEIKESEIV
jgi:hypothetical protein